MTTITQEKRAIEKKPWLSGKAITGGLRAFNEWRDDFLIEASTGFLMLGFVAGTVDVFTKGGLSSSYTFTIAWATVQAIAIDGLFFAVWGKVARAQWTREAWFKNLMLVLVGLLLAVVATLVNGILSYQELMDISNVKDAMAKLAVDQAMFTYARSVLVVLVSILVALFCRSKAASELDSSATPVQVAQATQITEASPESSALPEKAESVDRSLDRLVHGGNEASHSSQKSVARSPELHSSSVARGQDGYMAVDDGSTVAIADGNGQAMVATGSHREKIKWAMAQAMQSGQATSYGDIARLAGVGYSTVKKHAPSIREELQASQ